jgi:phospholipid transport system substrate-binding protein
VLRSLRLIIAVVASALFVSFAFVGPARAGAATDFVKKTQGDLFTALKAGDDKKVDSLFDQFIDYGAFAEGSLGSEWAARSDAEKAQFQDLLKQIIRNAYRCNLKKTLNFTIDYASESGGPSGSTVVKTKAAKGGDTIEINFRVAPKGSAWKVQDIETEGVSLVDNNRSQFIRIIKKDGFSKLIDKMKDKASKPACDG